MSLLNEHTSIRTRLLFYLIPGLFTVWLAANAAAAAAALHELNEAADSQMSEVARALPYTIPQTPVRLPDIDDVWQEHNGSAEDKHNGIAVWDIRGRLLLSDQKGSLIPWRTVSGFVNTGSMWASDSWRVLYLHDEESGRTVAVAQQWRERLSTLSNAVFLQALITLLALPLLGWLLAAAVGRGLAPLKRLTDEIGRRNADTLIPVSDTVPAEVRPLTEAINNLFDRLCASREREQRFTADAAHELRSPLAALKVQAEVLALSQNAEQQQHHLQQIQAVIGRAEHLITQLLTLARLDPEQSLPVSVPLDWQEISGQALQSVNLSAREKHIRLKRESDSLPLPLHGDPALMTLLLRNLLDNAVRYSPEHSTVCLTLRSDALEISDNGPGISQEYLPQITERFYRPPGQNAQGSGLGLSIVEQIARLHGLSLQLYNHTPHGLTVRLYASGRQTDGLG